jgi:hypothetical protein
MHQSNGSGDELSIEGHSPSLRVWKYFDFFPRNDPTSHFKTLVYMDKRWLGFCEISEREKRRVGYAGFLILMLLRNE